LSSSEVICPYLIPFSTIIRKVRPIRMTPSSAPAGAPVIARIAAAKKAAMIFGERAIRVSPLFRASSFYPSAAVRGNRGRGPGMLQLDGIEAGYGNVQILNGVSLAVERGQIVALLGGNGTGKSTLLKTISGLLAPWRGAIRFDGERIDG